MKQLAIVLFCAFVAGCSAWLQPVPTLEARIEPGPDAISSDRSVYLSSMVLSGITVSRIPAPDGLFLEAFDEETRVGYCTVHDGKCSIGLAIPRRVGGDYAIEIRASGAAPLRQTRHYREAVQ